LRATRTLDFKRIAPKLRTPVVQNAHFVGESLWITKGMRHIRVPCSDTQRLLFATTTNQNRDGIAYRTGHVNFPAMPDDFQ
jgi:hypothetical protein